MFHTRNGLFFERLLNGMVRVVKTNDGKEPGTTNVLFDDTMDKNTFASVIASMSISGETPVSYGRALEVLSK